MFYPLLLLFWPKIIFYHCSPLINPLSKEFKLKYILHAFSCSRKQCDGPKTRHGRPPDMWHVTLDTWHVTCDMWHMTCDTWQVGGGEPFSPNFSSLAHVVWEWRCFEDIFTKDELPNEWINELINYKGVCRTAPATPGLLKIYQGPMVKWANVLFVSANELYWTKSYLKDLTRHNILRPYLTDP